MSVTRLVRPFSQRNAPGLFFGSPDGVPINSCDRCKKADIPQRNRGFRDRPEQEFPALAAAGSEVLSEFFTVAPALL